MVSKHCLSHPVFVGLFPCAKLDENLKQILPTAARTIDKKLARIQIFVLDMVSLLISLL